MANTVLTPSEILRETYAVMHQVSNFIMNTNRQYDGRFAQEGAKIGQNLDVRLPAKFVTRRGNTMSSQNYVERKVPLPLATIDGIDLNFTQEQLTFDIDEFSKRVIRPAVSQLMSTVEADALSQAYKAVPNYVGVVTTTTGSGLTYLQFQGTGMYLTDNLAPIADRHAVLNSESRVFFSNDVKGQFQSAEAINKQYVDGIVGRTGGYDVYENTLVPAHVSGTHTGTITVTTSATGDTGYDGTGNAWPTGDAFDLKVDTADPMAFEAGDIITISGVYDVHPESKQSYGYLKRFVVQADTSGSGGTTISLPILPFPILSGAYKNVSAAIADGATVTKHGAASGGTLTYGQNLMFHRDAFAFVTADLVDPSQFGAWGAREVFEGMSMRIWRQGDIVNGTFPCRLDLAWGFAPIYPEWSCRHTHVRGLVQ